MIIGPDFCLVGMPKCGCVFSRYMLTRAGLVDEFLGHTPLSQIPAAKRQNKRLIGMVRNPFAWYVSRWADWNLHYSKNTGPMDFEPWLEKYLYQPKSSPMMSVCRDFPDSKAALGTFTYTHIAFHCEDAAAALENWTRDDFREDYHSLLSCPIMIRTEQLSQEAPTVYGERVKKHLDAPRNSNPHPPWRECYSRGLREEVEFADSLVLELYGYQFD